MSTADVHAAMPLRRAEYEQLVDAGLLEGEPIELLGGRRVLMSPESAEHSGVIHAIAEQLSAAASGAGLQVRIGHPIALSDLDEPEPDVALVADDRRHYRSAHPGPRDVHLIVEVARSSLPKDLGEKVARYAAAGISEYWVVDLRHRRTVVHRDPDATSASYRSVTEVTFGSGIAPLAMPATLVVVD